LFIKADVLLNKGISSWKSVEIFKNIFYCLFKGLLL